MITPASITTVLSTPFGKQFDMPFKLQMMERVSNWRARLIRNTLDRNPNDRHHFTQELVFAMEDCGEGSITVNKIPKSLRLGLAPFDYLGGESGKQPFGYVPLGGQLFNQAGRYAALLHTYRVSGNRAIVTKKNMNKILINAIFDDPMEALACSCEKCDPWNSEYKITRDIAQLIIQSIMEVDYNRNLNDVNTTDLEVTTNPQS